MSRAAPRAAPPSAPARPDDPAPMPDPAGPAARSERRPAPPADAPARLGFRQCDPRFPFLWRSDKQPAARWHAAGEGPANYFADTPTGAWAELLRHEEITDPDDLAGLRRALWVVELPADAPARPRLADEVLTGPPATYPACQAEARRLRRAGAVWLQAPSAALQPGGASGLTVGDTGLGPAPTPRDGQVWVRFGAAALTGWPVVEAGTAPAGVLARVRPLADDAP